MQREPRPGSDPQGSGQNGRGPTEQDGQAAEQQGGPFRGRWRGATVVCIASGPSLTADDCEAVRRWRVDAGAGTRQEGSGDASGEQGSTRRVIAVNNSFERAPWADAIYGCDRKWWVRYAKPVRKICTGEFWTINEHAAKVDGLNRVFGERGSGVSTARNTVMEGGNSGYQAVGLAILFGAARIILLGYDMQFTAGKKHWHGDHGDQLHNPTPLSLKTWAGNFNLLAAQSPAEIINCSRATALTCFPRMGLDESLARTA
jgi:hypothetical protein